jgi:hypothetical protein
MKRNYKTRTKTYLYYTVNQLGDYIPHFNTFSYPVTSLKSYPNHSHLYIKLTPVAQALILFLAERMHSETNLVINHPSERDEFISFMKRSINADYKDATVRKAVTELKLSGYLMDVKKARRLIVNPLYYFRGSEIQREILIGQLLHEACDPRGKNMDVISKLHLSKF